MGTEVLRPQDVLSERFRVSPAAFHRRRNFSGTGNFVSNPKHHTRKPVNRPERSDQKKKTNVTRAVEDVKPRAANHGLVMGQVTILRRGESLDSLSSTPKSKGKPAKPVPIDDLAICGTDRLGPDLPEMVPKQIKLVAPPSAPAGLYAGSAMFMSPSPRAVPLPSFFGAKKPDEDSATKDLRRLLRLE